MKTAIVIPARLASTRLPGKPLLAQTGKPLLVHVLENAARIRGNDTLLVATDDNRILQAARAAGFEGMMTSPQHASGTDRLAEVAQRVTADVFINLQGDEPTVDIAAVEALIAAMHDDPRRRMGTLVTALADEAAYRNPNVVKAVCDASMRALYFSRAPIPHCRDGFSMEKLRAARVFKHLGVYAYRRDLLAEFTAWPRGGLEQIEQLEQLRALEHGVAIHAVVSARDSIGIDTPADYAAFLAAWQTKTTAGSR